MEKKTDNPDNINIMSIDEIQKGGRFDRYVRTAHDLLLGDSNSIQFEKFENFLKEIFHQVLCFLIPNSPRLGIKLLLVYKNEQYLTLERQADESRNTIKFETSRGPSTAFVLDSGLTATICVNVYRLLQKNSATLIMNYVDALVHEANHIIDPHKTEQEVHDIGIPILEEFLGIKLPSTYKNQRASDYYF